MHSPAEQAVEDLLVTSSRSQIMEGVTTWRNRKNGFKVIDLSYKADPRKRDPEWVAQAQRGMPRAEFEREFGDKWIVYDGKPVYPDYDEDIHVLKGSIYALKRCRLISGWDAGPNDLNLAWALGLAFPQENAILFIDEYFVDDGDGISFLEAVKSRLSLEWFRISGGFSIHVADQSVFTQDNRTKSCFADDMRKYGMPPMPGAISFAERRKVTGELLTSLYRSGQEGKAIPKWRVHERCTLLREAMGGGYCYPKAVAGVGGDYKPTPAKNRFSHIANAAEYACSRLSASAQVIPYEGRSLPHVSVI